MLSCLHRQREAPRLKNRQPQAAQRRFCRRAPLYHCLQRLRSCNQHLGVLFDLLEVQQPEHLDVLHQVSVDEGGNLLIGSHVAGELTISVAAIEVASE